MNVPTMENATGGAKPLQQENGMCSLLESGKVNEKLVIFKVIQLSLPLSFKL